MLTCYSLCRTRPAGPYTSFQSVSGASRCSPGGRRAYFSKCSGRNGSEMTCSSPSHLPRSINLHRFEQKGPYAPANQAPTFRHVGHRTCGFGDGIAGTLLRRAAAYFQASGFELVRGGDGQLWFRATDLEDGLNVGNDGVELRRWHGAVVQDGFDVLRQAR